SSSEMSLKDFEETFDVFYKNPQKLSNLTFEELEKLVDLAVSQNPKNNKRQTFLTSNKNGNIEKTILNKVPLEKLTNFISTLNFNVDKKN
ncbi:17321_t:CDS:1, partial [Funneliformis caledonium]